MGNITYKSMEWQSRINRAAKMLISKEPNAIPIICKRLRDHLGQASIYRMFAAEGNHRWSEIAARAVIDSLIEQQLVPVDLWEHVFDELCPPCLAREENSKLIRINADPRAIGVFHRGKKRLLEIECKSTDSFCGFLPPELLPKMGAKLTISDILRRSVNHVHNTERAIIHWVNLKHVDLIEDTEVIRKYYILESAIVAFLNRYSEYPGLTWQQVEKCIRLLIRWEDRFPDVQLFMVNSEKISLEAADYVSDKIITFVGDKFRYVWPSHKGSIVYEFLESPECISISDRAILNELRTTLTHAPDPESFFDRLYYLIDKACPISKSEDNE